MATFYGGEQLTEIREIERPFGNSENITDEVLYTVPTGFVAYVAFVSSSLNFLSSVTVEDPDTSTSASVPNFGTSTLNRFAHPNADQDNFAFMGEGFQLKATGGSIGTGKTLKFVAYVFKKP